MKEVVRIFIQLLTILAGYVAIFAQLHRPSIRIWDEARLANNAVEMYNTGLSLVTTYHYEPDLWNTKPPLLIWLQMLSFKLLGISEISVRLPSALAGAFTCLLIYFFCTKVLKEFWVGILSVWMLLTTNALLFNHGMRTADYDSLMILFMIAASMSYYMYSRDSKVIYFYAFVLLTISAVLTKSVAGLLFIPAVYIYTVYKKQLIDRLKSGHTYLGILLFLIIIGGYYISRELTALGYLEAVAENELGGRFLETVENHKHGVFYYIENIFTRFMIPWSYLGVIGLFLPLFWEKLKGNKDWLVWLTTHIVTYLIIISVAQTKLEWYDHPIYPFLALSASYCIILIINKLKKYVKVVSISLVCLLVGILYVVNIDTYLSLNLKPDSAEYNLSNYMERCIVNNDISKFDGADIIYSGYDAHVKFYVEIMNDQGINARIVPNRHFKSDKIIVSDSGYKKYIDKHYEYIVSQQDGPIYHIDLIKKVRE